MCMNNSVQGDAPVSRVLTSFDGGSDFQWYTVNDNVMGGRSKGRFDISQGKLTFSGEINTNGGGFASIRTAAEQLDLANYGGIRVRLRGDGRTYKFRLVGAEADVSYMAEVPTRSGEWQLVELLFSDCLPSWRGRRLDRPPLEPAEINSIGFMLSDKRDGPFVLQVDWIEAMPGG